MDNNPKPEEQGPETIPSNTQDKPVVDLSTSGDFAFTEETILASLAYLGPLVFITFLAHKKNPFVIFHLKQGLVLFALSVFLYVSYRIFMISIFDILSLGIWIFAIIGIINALQRKEKELPIIGGFSSKIKI